MGVIKVEIQRAVLGLMYLIKNIKNVLKKSRKYLVNMIPGFKINIMLYILNLQYS